MKHQVDWHKTLLEDFIEEGLLSEDEEKLMRMRVKNKSTIYQADELGVGTATIDRMVVELKRKYDVLHNKFPERFPKRELSNKEQKSLCKDDRESSFPRRCLNCSYLDSDNMSALDLVECQLNCKSVIEK